MRTREKGVPIFAPLIGPVIKELEDRVIAAPLPVGVERVPVYLGNEHARLDRSFDHAREFYEHGCIYFGDVDIAATSDGAIKMVRFYPQRLFSPIRNWRFRRSELSPDWRRVDGRLKMAAILAHRVSSQELVEALLGR